MDIRKLLEPGNVSDFTVDGKCAKCGACCSTFLPLTVKEIKRLKGWVKKHDYKPVPVLDALDITCPFLDKDTLQCACYEARPEVCRIFLCKTMHDGIQPQLSRPQKRYELVNLRQVIFGEESVSFPEFNLLMQYLDGRVKANKEKQDE